MKKILIICILSAAFPFQGCGKKGGNDNNAPPEGPAMPARTAKIPAEYEAFAAKAESILNALDAQVQSYEGKLGDPGRIRHAARQRRQAIQAQYRLDKLRGRLQKRSRSYAAAIRELERIENGNPDFIRQYENDLILLEGTVEAVLKDTLH